jgi:hypothetical protein
MKHSTGRLLARRTSILAAGVCCLALLTGCPWDEDDFVPTLWDITWTDNVDPADSGDITVEIDIGDLNALTTWSKTYGDYTIDITVASPNITIEINDTTSTFKITLTGTIAGDGLSAAGSYTGTSSSGGALSGTWTIWQN